MRYNWDQVDQALPLKWHIHWDQSNCSHCLQQTHACTEWLRQHNHAGNTMKDLAASIILQNRLGTSRPDIWLPVDPLSCVTKSLL